MIKLENVDFRYKNNDYILKNINLNIEQGEFVSIIGKNGAGKSSISKLIAGITKPTNGTIYVDEIDTKSKKDFYKLRKKIGIVFQNPENQLVFANIEDDMKFMLENFNFSKDEISKRIDEALKLVSMEGYSQKDIYELSMGQKQRIAIAEMLALKPKYLILDEPTAMLDPLAKQELLETITNLNKKEAITIIYVTNIVDEILNADRVIALDEGEISFECTKDKIIDNIQKFKDVGLIVPKNIELIHELNKNGISIDKTNFDIKNIIEGIKKSKKC